MLEDVRAREDVAVRLKTRARIAVMALALGLEVVEVPGDGNCFLHAAKFALLQLHGWNYNLVPTQEAMRAEVRSFLREKREMLDMNGMSLDDVRLAWRDPRPIPPAGVVLGPVGALDGATKSVCGPALFTTTVICA